MEKIKNIVLVTLILMSYITKAQESAFVKKGLWNGQLTLSPSTMFSNKESYFYLHGNIEGFISNSISLAGEGYYYLGNLSSDESTFQYNHNLFFGASKHFVKNNHDIYFGFQPGIALTKLNPITNHLTETSSGTNPIFSTVLGYNFYVNNLFHFFVQTRYVTGEHNFDINKNLSEFRFSAGLGFNLKSL